MNNEFKAGEKVEWQSSQGKIEGKIQKKITESTQIKGYEAKASEEQPQYLVKSDKTGNLAAHKPKSLNKATKVRQAE